MNDTEQLVKDALGKLAERTPHPGPTLSALRRKRKRHRNVFMIATAGMAAVAVLIFAGVIVSDRYTPPNGNDAAAALMPGNSQSVALKYAPHWLPDGFVETFRAVDGDSKTTRIWVPSGAPAYPLADDGPKVQLNSGTGYDGAPGSWQDVTVRGLKARVQEFAGRAIVEWKAQVTLFVQVSGMDRLQETALRVADSVRADSDAVYQAPFKVKDKQANSFYGTSSGDWKARLSPAPVDVTVSSTGPDLGGQQTTPVTVRGKQGVLAGHEVLVQEGNLWISASSVEPGKSVEELVAAVNDVEIVSGIDTGWIRRN